jgi:Major Facilitator Superfamily
VVSAGLMAIVAVAYNTGIVVLAVLVAIAGSFRGVGDRAKNTMLKPLMDATDMDTVRVTSAYAGVGQLAQLVGGSVAGVLIALFNPWGAIWIDVASFLVCALIIISLVFTPKPEPAPLIGVDGVYTSAAAKAVTEPYIDQLRDGFKFLRHDPLISSMVSMLFVTNLFAQVGTAAFIPLWIDSRLDHSPIALGWIGGAYALGGIAGNAVFTAFAPKLPRYKTFVLGYFLGGAPRFLVLAFSHNLAVVVAVWAVSGFALSSANPTIGAVMYNRIPLKLLARVGSLSSAIAFAGFSVGGVVGGLSVERMGFTAAVIFASSVYFCATLTPLFGHSTWRLIDTVTKSARRMAAEARITVRLVLSNHQWTASARGRDGADIVRAFPVHDGDVAYALGMVDAPGLGPMTRVMLQREHARALEREQELREALDVSERRLGRIQEAVAATHDETSSLPTGTVYRSTTPSDLEPEVDLPVEGIDALDAGIEAANAEAAPHAEAEPTSVEAAANANTSNGHRRPNSFATLASVEPGGRDDD